MPVWLAVLEQPLRQSIDLTMTDGMAEKLESAMS